ncbi:MAG: DNA-3-methyladenine glycosylase 2 family protein [Oscillospiraceae bacterium]|nr:DNA-3-methyladenine glycosylase 2 family protein [Oscillospiraceae bacterium]
MDYFEREGEVEITGVSDFDLSKIFECGQCFRWSSDESGAYVGVAHGIAARVRKNGESIFISGTACDFESVWHDYFDLERDYLYIRRQLCIDDFMSEATKYGAGIRILRQDKWETLCSFIISQCNNIPRIKKIIATLCNEFGDKLIFEGVELYTFPSAEKIAKLNEADLAPLRCGYRSAYLIGAAQAIANGGIDLDLLSLAPQDEARKELKKLRGVGDKVADCVMLFGLHMLDAFPLDVWMKRAVSQHLGPEFNQGIFSPYAGIAQQYIFHYVRNARGSSLNPGLIAGTG